MKSINFSRPEISKGKTWFVFFYYRHPDWPDLPLRHSKNRVKVTGAKIDGFKSLNRIPNKKERLEEAKLLCDCYFNLLKEGYNPWAKSLAVPMEPVTINQAFDQILALLKGLKPKSYKNHYKTASSSFLKWISKNYSELEMIEDIGKAHAVRYIDDIEIKLQAKTRNNYLSALRGIFRKMIERDLISENPFADIKKIKAAENPYRAYRYAQLHQVRDYWLAKDAWMWLAAQIVMYCAIRIDELRQLQVYMVNLDAGVIEPPGTITKNQNALPVVIPPHLEEQLSIYLAEAHPDHYVFTSAGRPGDRQLGFKTIREKWVQMRKDTGLNKQLKIYGLKHTGGIITAMATKDMLLVKDQFRHKSLDQSYGYLSQYHLLDNRKDKLKNVNAWENENGLQ